MKRKYKKKTERQKLYDKLDDAWSLIIKFNGYCGLCGKTMDRYNAHHLVGRTHVKTRWDLENGVCLCGGCHIRVHADTLVAEELIVKLRKNRGEKWYKELVEKKKETVKYNIAELEEKLSTTKLKLKRLEKNN